MMLQTYTIRPIGQPWWNLQEVVVVADSPEMALHIALNEALGEYGYERTDELKVVGKPQNIDKPGVVYIADYAE